jgi:alpha-beta hydrolase superfamily lysophospholipase
MKFPSTDRLEVTADSYPTNGAKDLMVLCHRSHFNRGEYRETAPKLNAFGYDCLAIDQRSGMKVLGTTNETYALAKQKGLTTGYLAAKPDIEAAIVYAFAQNGNRPIILVGSSYSAALSLLIASENSEKIKAVVAFSPGEYLKGINLASAIQSLKIPVFITSSRKEIQETEAICRFVDQELVTLFKPVGEGAHGSRVLWGVTPNHTEYWAALLGFLTTL